MSAGTVSITDARLMMLPFALLNWLIAWSLRFVRTPINNPLVRLSVQLLLATTLLGIMLAQMLAYRYLSGIRVLEQDHFFMATFIVEYVIFLCIVLLSASKLQRKARNQTASTTIKTNTRSPKTN